jgi:hypothetical protein
LDFIFFYVRYSTLLRLPPLRFHCLGGCWDLTQDSCDLRHWLSDALTNRLDLIHYSARSHPLGQRIGQDSQSYESLLWDWIGSESIGVGAGEKGYMVINRQKIWAQKRQKLLSIVL